MSAQTLDKVGASLRRKRYAPKTIRLYVGHLRRLESFVTARGRVLNRATIDDLIDYAETLPFTYGSRQAFINALRAYYRHHLRRAEPTPAESLRCPSRPPMVYRGLESGADARSLIEAAGRWGNAPRAAAALGYYAALRCEEIASLPREGDWGDQLNVMGKGAQPRIVPVHAELRTILDAQVADIEKDHRARHSPYFFPGRYSVHAHASTQTVYMWIKVAGADAGLGNVTPHMLRYTSAAVMYESEKDLRATGEYLGHSRSSSAITWGYTRTRDIKMRALMQSL